MIIANVMKHIMMMEKIKIVKNVIYHVKLVNLKIFVLNVFQKIDNYQIVNAKMGILMIILISVQVRIFSITINNYYLFNS